jgi:hypothetical protein
MIATGSPGRGNGKHQSGMRIGDGIEQLRHERPEIGKSVRQGFQDSNCDREDSDVLLKGEITINRHEDIEAFSGERKQFAVSDRDPTHLAGGFDFVADKVARKTPVYALVEEHLHAVVATSRSFAASRNAMTCARVTVGNPARNSSIEPPASR